MMLDRSYWVTTKSKISAWIELAIVVGVAAWIGRDYLHLDYLEVPSSPEFMAHIQSHGFWTLLVECGSCALWNSSAQGGFPAFADYSGSGIHPVIGLATYVWGFIVGSKIAIVLSIGIAGCSQWWLGRELNIKGVLRVWGAIVVLAGGHLASRMETGAFPVLFSTALCSLMIPGIIRLAKSGESRDSVILGILLASSLASGGVHLQIGLMAVIPGLFILLLSHQGLDKDLGKKFVLAAGIGLLLAAPFLIPFLHFVPNIETQATSDIRNAQPLEYIPLNFVIRDPAFNLGNALGKIGDSADYISYIGWLPILLAFVGFAQLIKHPDGRIGFFLVSGIMLSLYLASDLPWRGYLNRSTFNGAVIQPGYILGITVPLIVGLASLGANDLFDVEHRLTSLFLGRRKTKVRISLFALLLIFPLSHNIISNISASREYLTTRFQSREVGWSIKALYSTETQEWVSTPEGESAFIAPAVSSRLKLSSSLLPWNWRDRELPIPRLEASREAITGALVIYQSQEVGGTSIYIRPEVHYAMVESSTERSPCEAEGLGGHLVVNCNNEEPGILMIKENNFDGWKVSRDGDPIPLHGGTWLSVDAPPGEHEYIFDYSPWDVKVGLVLFGISTVLIIKLMFFSKKRVAS
jgi:hypothetical protein